MNILEKILASKEREVALRRKTLPEYELTMSTQFTREPRSLRASIMASEHPGLIAEFKRRSPSRGVINGNAKVAEVVAGYTDAGASAISVLTDSEFFGGELSDLLIARQNSTCPILRKDFIVDPYQVLEARAYGADAVLLIARALPTDVIISLQDFAKSLGLEVLLEIHSREDLQRIDPTTFDLIGINCRDLATFKTDRAGSISLLRELPTVCATIAESGIGSAAEAAELSNIGFKGFLIGELFMRDKEPQKSCARFVQDYSVCRGAPHVAA